MELAKQSVSDLYLTNGDMPLDLEHITTPQTVVDHTVHAEVSDMTAQIISLEGQKLDLQVSSQPIIEPISPAEVTLEESALTMTTYEATEDETPGTNGPEDTQVPSTQADLELSDPHMPNEILSTNSFVLDSSHVEPTSDFIVHTDPRDALLVPTVRSVGLDPSTLMIETSTEATCDTSFLEPASNSINGECSQEQRKNIPPKKDRMDPLKLDMSKPSVIPLTSSQLSLQCLECHIIFSDNKSKERHLKMNHPTEYEQCMLGDALFACYVCDRHFNCSTELMTHQRAHTEKQPFKCPICGEAFKRSSELTNHKKVHFGKHGYTCLDCGKLCKTVTLLKYHQRIHTGERPYVCIHKECGKRFSMPKALQKHLETHEKEDAEGTGDATATASTKKRRNKGPSIKKFACSQCEESFRTAKAQLHHIKVKHPQYRVIPSSNNSMVSQDLNGLAFTTPPAVVQPPLLRMEAIGPAPQQIGPLGAEEIKRLIEKLGNVQKVNQLIILGVDQFQTQTMGMPQPQGAIQPLQFNFTEPLIQAVVHEQTEDEARQEGMIPCGTEQSAWKESIEIEVAVAPEETTVQREETVVSEVNPETQVTAVESDMTEGQLSEVHFELVPEITEKADLTPQLEETSEHIYTTEEQHIQVASDIKTLETGDALSLISITDFESTPSQTSEDKTVPAPVDILGSEETITHAESVVEKSDPAAPLVETVQQNEEVNIVNCDNNQELETQLEQPAVKEITFIIEPISPASQPPLDNVQHDQETALYEQTPCTDSVIQQRTVITDDLNVPNIKDCIYVRKKLPIKKKRSKKQVARKSQAMETPDKVAVSASKTTSQKANSSSKSVPKKGEKAKSKKLVRFGRKKTKEKYSKCKLLQNASLHIDVDSGEVAVLSQNVSVKKLKKKNQKYKKGMTDSSGPTKAFDSPPSGPKVMKVQAPVQAQTPRGKPQKRKLNNQKDLENKGKSVLEIQENETHMTKKKRSGKIQEAASRKKAKIKNATEKELSKEFHTLAKHKKKEQKSVPKSSYQDPIKQQALLLLKGHKQPQIKVHKLDAKTTGFEQPAPQKCKTKPINDQEITVMQDKLNTQSKSLQTASQKKRKAKAIQKKPKEDSSLKMTTTDNSVTPAPSHTKAKVVRKRKSSMKMDQEIALSPPYSRLTIGCQDCGTKFSEVSALQEHMASMHSENGTLQSNMTCDVSNNPTMSPRSSEVMLSNAVHISNYEIQVSTDWDVECEMREIGLGDRDEHRLSFPALNPSPSFPNASTFVEGESRDEERVHEEAPPGHIKPLGESCTVIGETLTHVSFPESDTCHGERNDKNSDEEEHKEAVSHPISVTEAQNNTDIKVEVPSGVNLVMVEAQNDGDDHISTQHNSVSNDSQKSSNQQDASTPGEPNNTNTLLQDQTPVTKETPASTQNTDQDEIREANKEVHVQRTENQTKTYPTRGRRGRGGRGRGKRLGKRNAENRNTEEVETNQEECQVVYQLYTLNDNCEEKDEGRGRPKTATDASTDNTQSTLGESTKDRVVSKSVGTNVEEVMKSEQLQKNVEQDKEGSPSRTVLDESMTPHIRNEDSVRDQCEVVKQGNSQPQTEGLSSAATSTDVKTEASPSVLVPNNVQASERDVLQGVRMFVVKAEDHNFVNETHDSQENQLQTNRSTCQEKHFGHSSDGIPSGTPAVLPSAGKQCVFYPVKEEEGEVLVGPPQGEQGLLVTEVQEERTRKSGSWAASDVEECEEVRVGCTQMEMHHNLYSNAAEGEAGTEQQGTQDSAEFLSQSSDTEDIDSLSSEPEAESLVMSCYLGIQVNGGVQKRQSSRYDQNGRTFNNAGHFEAERQGGSRKECWKPIDYFVQYFNCDTWKEIADCTSQVSKLSVTTKEVGQFVGIHIAMGTLKFPSMKLYWEDLTRVPLIADAMSVSRFTEIAHKIRLAVANRDASQANGNGRCRQRSTFRICRYQNAQNLTETSVLMSDPLWRVQAIVNQVQEGCRKLERSGNHAVDQYPLPFQRHPTHSLHHTVMVSANGLVMDFNMRVNDCNREEVVEKMVSQGNEDNQGMVFLCKPELSTPSMLEHLLQAGVRSAGKVGGARGQVGDEFVTSDGKLKLFRCHHGFILSAVTKEKSRSTSLVSGFERAIKAANLNRDLRSLYRTPCTSPSPSAWPQSVLWDLVDLALVNSWLQYKEDGNHVPEILSLMSFRLEVAKALILSGSVDAHDSSSPYPPAPERPGPNATVGASEAFDTPLPDAATRYDGLGHWPEQLAEAEEGKCRFGGCERTSRVRCLKCCVFLCISRNHNCFLKFHNQGAA